MSISSQVHRVTIRILLIFCLSGMGGCFFLQPARAVPSQETKDAVRETVFRYLFDTSPWKGGHARPLNGAAVSAWKIYFIRVDDQDPTARLLKRFANHVPPVKPWSASVVDTTGKDWAMYSVKDKKSRVTGVHFWIRRLYWLSGKRVQCEAGYGSGGRNAWSARFIVTRYGKRWSVVRFYRAVVS